MVDGAAVVAVVDAVVDGAAVVSGCSAGSESSVVDVAEVEGADDDEGLSDVVDTLTVPDDRPC